MKKVLLLIICIICSMRMSSQALFDYVKYVGHDDYYAEHPLQDKDSFYNPILPGFYPDPTIVGNGRGDYYLANSTFAYFPGVPLFHSSDLVHWEQIGNVLSRESQLQNMIGQGTNGGIYAPSLTYDEKSNTYYMITTNVGAGNFYVKAKATDDGRLEGCKWSDPIYLPTIHGIDPSIFIDDDGRAYIVNNDNAPDGKPEYDGHCTIRLQELDLSTDKTKGKRRILINKGSRPEQKPIWCEGPHIYKVNGVYYLMTAEGGTGEEHSEVIYRSKSIWGPYESYDKNPILTQRTLLKERVYPVTCSGHADMIQTTDGKWWIVFLACRPVEKEYENLGRETFIMPLTWNSDGWPEVTMSDKCVPLQLKKEHSNDVDVKSVYINNVYNNRVMGNGNFSWTDEFNDSKLSLEWIGLRKDPTSLYEIHEGWLLLKNSNVKATEKKQPALIGRRLQHSQFDVTARMRFKSDNPNEHAGMMLYKDEMNQLLLLRTEDKVVLTQIEKGVTTKLGEVDVVSDDIQLRIESTGTDFQFLCKEKDRAWHTVGIASAAILSTRNASGFTGTTVALYGYTDTP